MYLLSERDRIRDGAPQVGLAAQRHCLGWTERAALPKAVPGVAKGRHHGVDEANWGAGGANAELEGPETNTHTSR